tara:strand:+ start:1011 stop:2558 length:1548 start_codon:yes stop_codon:yes gene_type:complete
MNVLFENVDFDYTKKNIEKHMDVSNLQTYFPIIDNYIDNSEYEEDAHLILKSRFILKGLIENNTEDFTQKQSPYIKTFYNSKVYDRFSKKTIEKNIFIKKNPIVDVLGYSMNQYSLSNHVLPNITSCITSEYINNYNNEAYIDSFFTFIGSKLTETRRCPTFPLFYGTYNCVSNNLKFDISEEYYDVMSNPDFENNINKKFVIEEVEIEDEPYEDHVFELIETDMEVDVLELDQLYQDNQSTLEGLPSMEELPDTLETTNISNIDITQLDSLDDLSDLEETDDTFKYLNVKNFPTQLIFMEKLEQTLDDLLEEQSISEIEWLSIIFQICFGLSVAQKKFHFVHNDLHSSNIMFAPTDKQFMYFEVNNVSYKIPTFGKVTKIIDFGRATFTHDKTLYFSSTFDTNGDAEGQYDYPTHDSLHNCKVKPNKSFDLARLATTIIEHFEPNSKIFNLLKTWMTDKYNHFIIDDEDDFDLYIKIAKDIKNAIPLKQMSKPIFKRFIINKKKIHNPYEVFVF